MYGVLILSLLVTLNFVFFIYSKCTFCRLSRNRDKKTFSDFKGVTPNGREVYNDITQMAVNSPPHLLIHGHGILDFVEISYNQYGTPLHVAPIEMEVEAYESLPFATWDNVNVIYPENVPRKGVFILTISFSVQTDPMLATAVFQRQNECVARMEERSLPIYFKVVNLAMLTGGRLTQFDFENPKLNPEDLDNPFVPNYETIAKQTTGRRRSGIPFTCSLPAINAKGAGQVRQPAWMSQQQQQFPAANMQTPLLSPQVPSNPYIDNDPNAQAQNQIMMQNQMLAMQQQQILQQQQQIMANQNEDQGYPRDCTASLDPKVDGLKDIYLISASEDLPGCISFFKGLFGQIVYWFMFCFGFESVYEAFWCLSIHPNPYELKVEKRVSGEPTLQNRFGFPQNDAPKME